MNIGEGILLAILSFTFGMVVGALLVIKAQASAERN